MQILQFRAGGEYDYNVTYETSVEKQKIQTNDIPTGELLLAISSVVVAAIRSFKLENVTAQFRQITFSYPENSHDGFVLELTMRTKENPYVKHFLKTERLLLYTDDATSTNEAFQARIEHSNSLIEKILTLRDEIALYANGARAQKELPFEDASESSEDDEGSLFDDDEDEFDTEERKS
jgi:hypothetical protein